MNVAQTKGTLVQNFCDDPGEPAVADALADPEMRDVILEASLLVPIHFCVWNPDQLKALLPTLKEGRFIINTWQDDTDMVREMVRAVREASSL